LLNRLYSVVDPTRSVNMIVTNAVSTPSEHLRLWRSACHPTG
jgi:hypothetical protein